jgi:uncharacterized protein YndB with AHSA1/START domain
VNESLRTSCTLVGTLVALDERRGTVRMEDVFDTDIDDLWAALTEPERLLRWIGTVTGDLRPGGTIHARFTSTWEGPGRIEICEAPRRLLLTMEPGSPDETVTEAVLTSSGDQTRLVIEERGLSLKVLYQHGAGWHAHVEDLRSYLDGRVPADWKKRWSELKPTYENLPIVGPTSGSKQQ